MDKKIRDSESTAPLNVTAAIIRKDERFFLAQRPFRRGHHLSGLWEFPGGKVESGESYKEALSRELVEELDIQVSEFTFFTTSSSLQKGRIIDLHCYFVEHFSGIITLKEHRCALWLPLILLEDYPLAPGDVKPVEKLMKMNHSLG